MKQSVSSHSSQRVSCSAGISFIDTGTNLPLKRWRNEKNGIMNNIVSYVRTYLGRKKKENRYLKENKPSSLLWIIAMSTKYATVLNAITICKFIQPRVNAESSRSQSWIISSRLVRKKKKPKQQCCSRSTTPAFLLWRELPWLLTDNLSVRIRPEIDSNTDHEIQRCVRGLVQ
jgi:hypothetical protein